MTKKYFTIFASGFYGKNMKQKYIFLLFLFIGGLQSVFAQEEKTITTEFHWNGVQQAGGIPFLSCEEAQDLTPEGLPVYALVEAGEAAGISVSYTIKAFSPLSEEEKAFVSSIELPAFHIEKKLRHFRKQARWVISFIPLAINEKTHQWEKIRSIEIKIQTEPDTKSPIHQQINYAEQSVLRQGTWHKISVDTTGIFKISYQDFVVYGINPDDIVPENIRIFGNGGRNMPETLSLPREDDLKELSIDVEDGNDGSFDPGDFVLFYATGPENRDFVNQEYYRYSPNIYTRKSYYFLTLDQGSGLRIPTDDTPLTPTDTINSFPDVLHYEVDEENLIASGKRWYGHALGEGESLNFTMHLQNPVPNTEYRIEYALAARIFSNGKVAFTINQNVGDSNIIFFKPNLFKVAHRHEKHYSFPLTSEDLNFSFFCLPNNPSSKIWFDYLTLTYQRQLIFDSGAMQFIDFAKEGNKRSLFRIQSPPDAGVWDVSTPNAPVAIQTAYDDGILSFVRQINNTNTFVILDKGASFPHPHYESPVTPQNIHAAATADMVIVAPEAYLPQAQRLADLHAAKDGLSCLVLSDQNVYNEFSSGKMTPVAIRNMMKFFYDKYPDNYPKYLLLMADGSYDYKGILGTTENQIPPFETLQSLMKTNSVVIEDFFGCLDDDEGDDGEGIVDIATGRMCVSSYEQAKQMVDKIEKYMNDSEICGDWQRKICFIADDEEGNLFLSQADTIAVRTRRTNPDIENVKIYFDTYQQQQTPNGDRYPDVNQRINQTIDRGALIVNYIGHGSEIGWSEERVLDISMINSWNNNRYPLFVTATCEFSKFDDVNKISGGELTYLNPHGGAIAMITTYRLAWAGANNILNKKFFNNLFNIQDNNFLRLGDIYILSKNVGATSRKNIGILGDPALRLALPSYRIKDFTISNQTALDTLQSLMEVNFEAKVYDLNDNFMQDFNGNAEIQLFDKKQKIHTLGNDSPELKTTYYVQNTLLNKVIVPVDSGTISGSIFVPLDMEQEYGQGLFRLFAKDGGKTAMGSFDDFMLGGTDADASIDNTPPAISLYINDNSFRNGDTISNEAVLLANLSDEHGINISNQGLGHDLFMYIDDDFGNPILLPDYYHPESGAICCGSLTYALEQLETGQHTIQLFAWDNYNNRGSANISFYFLKEKEIIRNRIYVAPNPLEQSTSFYFSDAPDYENFDIQLFIYDLNGKERYRYENSVFTLRGDYKLFSWDGRDLQGHRLPAGVYLYYAIIRDELGHRFIQSQKIIVR